MQKTIKINKIYKDYGLFYQGRYLFLFGGAGSGKSYFATQKVCHRFFTEEKKKILIIRKTAANIAKSVWPEILKYISSLSPVLYARLHINKVEKTIMDTHTGNEMVFMGVDDPEKLKSIQGITDVWIEEVTELEEADFMQIDLRMRAPTSTYSQIIASFNPVDISHWLVKYVEPQLLENDPQAQDYIKGVKDLEYNKENVWSFDFDNGKGRVGTRVLNTTSEHNCMITSTYQMVLDKLSAQSPVYYSVYRLGRWGEPNRDSKYAWAFDQNKHVESLPFLEESLHFTLDFNVNPFMSCLVIQIEHKEDYDQINVISEYALKHPKNTGYDIGDTLYHHYSDKETDFYLYGDASGNNKTGHKKWKTLFEEVEAGMKDMAYLTKKRIPRSNPRYAPKGSIGRKNFLNMILGGKIPEVRIKIDPACRNLIKDLRMAEQDEHGKLSKKKGKINGKVAELHGHMLQALEYFICHKDTFGRYAKLKK